MTTKLYNELDINSNNIINANLVHSSSIGVGVLSPSGTVHILGTGATANDFIVENTTAGTSSRARVRVVGDGGYGHFEFRSASSTNLPGVLQIAADTNIVINPGNGAAALAVFAADSLTINKPTIVTGGTLQLFNSGATGYLTNQVNALLYFSQTGGTYPFDSNGNLVLQPRTSTGNAKDIVFATGDTTPVARMVINSSGQIGIGVNPDSFFNILQPGDASTDGINIERTGAYRGVIYLDATTDSMHLRRSNVSTQLILASSGNVGIGTSSPVGELDVYTAAATPYSTRLWVRQGSHYISVLATDTGDGSAIAWNNSEPLRFATISNTNYASWTERMRIDSSGNVGIGAASPGTYAPLYVYRNSNSGIATIIDNDSTGAASAAGYSLSAGTVSAEIMVLSNGYNSSGVYGTTASSLQIINRAASSIVFKTSGYTDAYERMRIDSSGNVGIGTTSPASILHVGKATNKSIIVQSSNNNYAYYGVYEDIAVLGINRDPANGSYVDTNKAAAAVYAGCGASSGYVELRATNTNNASPSAVLRANGDGNVGIGTTSPKMSLQLGDSFGLIKLGSGLASYGLVSRNAYNDGSWKRIVAENEVALLQMDHVGNIQFFTQSDANTAADSAITFAERMRVANGGNVGIGTTSPARTLDVAGAARIGATNQVEVTSQAAAVGDIKAGASIFVGNGTDRNLNILPNGAATAGSTLTLAAYNGSAWRSMVETAHVASGEPTLLLAKNGGNVGIGTSSPATKLHVYHAEYFPLLLERSSSEGCGIMFANSTTGKTSTDGFVVGIAADEHAFVWHHEANDIYFGTSNSVRMYIKANGNVGISTSAPGAKLEVSSSSSEDGIIINNTATDGDPYLSFALSGTKKFTMGVDDGDGDKFKIGTTAIGTGTALTINSSGQIGIGTTAPANPIEIQVGGITRYKVDSSGNNVIGGYLIALYHNTYDIGAPGLTWKNIYLTNNPVVGSDRRIKENIQESDLGLDFINKLIPRKYDKIKTGSESDSDTKNQYGLIAQELEEVLIELGVEFGGLIYSEDVDRYSIRYTELISPIIKSIQELDQKYNSIITTLMNKVDELTNRLNNLEGDF